MENSHQQQIEPRHMGHTFRCRLRWFCDVVKTRRRFNERERDEAAKRYSPLHLVHHSSAAQCSRMVSPHQHRSIISTSCWDWKVQCSSQLSHSSGRFWSHAHYTHSGCESLKHDYLYSIYVWICQVVFVWCTQRHFISTSHWMGGDTSPHLWHIVLFFSFPDPRYRLPCFGWSSRHKNLSDPSSWWQDRSLWSPWWRQGNSHILDIYWVQTSEMELLLLLLMCWC